MKLLLRCPGGVARGRQTPGHRSWPPPKPIRRMWRDVWGRPSTGTWPVLWRRRPHPTARDARGAPAPGHGGGEPVWRVTLPTMRRAPARCSEPAERPPSMAAGPGRAPRGPRRRRLRGVGAPVLELPDVIDVVVIVG